MNDPNDFGDDVQERGSEPGSLGSAFPSPQDRAFIFKVVSSLARTGIGFEAACQRVVEALEGAVDNEKPLVQKRAAFVRAVATKLKNRSTEARICEVLDDSGFLLPAEENAVLSVMLSEAEDPDVLSSAMSMAAEFAIGKVR